jgi:hypothetical protein
VVAALDQTLVLTIVRLLEMVALLLYLAAHQINYFH